MPIPGAALLAEIAVRSLGFWPLPPLQLAPAASDAVAVAVDQIDRSDGASLICPEGVAPLDVLRGLARQRPVLFHGSGRTDLDELAPVRFSSDTSAFGNQRAVYATSDPVWAMFFAVLDRRNPDFNSTRNGTMTVFGRRRTLGPRYLFAVNEAALGERTWRRGTVYVVARDGFLAEGRDLGVIDNDQWASVEPVRYLAKIEVGPEDFPFRDATFGYRPGENMLRTYLRIRAAGSARRSARAATARR